LLYIKTPTGTASCKGKTYIVLLSLKKYPVSNLVASGGSQSRLVGVRGSPHNQRLLWGAFSGSHKRQKPSVRYGPPIGSLASSPGYQLFTGHYK